MRKGKIVVAAMLVMELMLIAPSVDCMAEGNGKVLIDVSYDMEIEPEEGDNFTITYAKKSDQFEEFDFTIDASKYVEEDGEIEMKPDSYVILGIQYHGENADIVEQGYGTGTEFYCTESIDGTINIAIGKEPASRLVSRYGSEGTFVMDDTRDENGRAYREQIEEEASEKRQPEMEAPDPDDFEDYERKEDKQNAYTDGGSGTVVTDVGEAKIEHYDTEQKEPEKVEEKKSNPFTKLFILFGVAAAGFAVIFTLRKMGKI